MTDEVMTENRDPIEDKRSKDNKTERTPNRYVIYHAEKEKFLMPTTYTEDSIKFGETRDVFKALMFDKRKQAISYINAIIKQVPQLYEGHKFIVLIYTK